MSLSFSMVPVAWVSASRLQAEDDFWGGEKSVITLTDQFSEDALAGLQEFSHVEVLFLFHAVDPERVVSGARHPRNNSDWPRVGIFAQRGKNRPNRIGSTLCRIEAVTGRTLVVSELDAIDGTPVLDLKPVMQEFLPRDDVTQPAWSHELMQAYWLERRTDE